MSPIFLPLTPRYITLTLAVVAMLVFGAALAYDQRSIILAICLGISIFLVIVLDGLFAVFFASIGM